MSKRKWTDMKAVETEIIEMRQEGKIGKKLQINLE